MIMFFNHTVSKILFNSPKINSKCTVQVHCAYNNDENFMRVAGTPYNRTGANRRRQPKKLIRDEMKYSSNLMLSWLTMTKAAIPICKNALILN